MPSGVRAGKIHMYEHAKAIAEAGAHEEEAGPASDNDGWNESGDDLVYVHSYIREGHIFVQAYVRHRP